jgi:hypothetical protein
LTWLIFSFVSKLNIMEHLNEEKLSHQIDKINELIIKSSRNYIAYLKKLFMIYLDSRSLNYIANQKEASFCVSYVYLTNEQKAIHVDKYQWENIVNMMLGLQTISVPLFDFDNTNHSRLLNNLFDNLQEKNQLNALYDIEKIEIQFSIQKVYSTEINAKNRVEEWKNKVEEFVL